MTKARDTANIVGGGFSGTIAGATMEPTGDTAAGDNAAIGFTSAEGLIITGQGSTGDVTIKNDADALVAHVPTGTTGVNFAGDVIVPDGDLILGSTAVTATGAEINLIDGGTARGTTAVADGDGFLTNDGGTMRMTKVDTLATYMGTKIGGGMHEFINETTVSDAASYAFTAMDSNKYKSYFLIVYNLVTATNNQQIKGRTSPDGTNFDSGSADYSWKLNYNGSSTSDATANYARISQSSSDNANTGFSGTITILDPHNTSTETRIMFQYMNHFGGATGFPEVGDGAFLRVTAEASLGLQLFAASGNITSAKVTAYGITNS